MDNDDEPTPFGMVHDKDEDDNPTLLLHENNKCLDVHINSTVGQRSLK